MRGIRIHSQSTPHPTGPVARLDSRITCIKSHAHIDNKTLACDPAFILASLPPLTGTSGQESSSKEDEDSDLSHVHSMDSHAAFGSEGDVGSQWMRS